MTTGDLAGLFGTPTGSKFLADDGTLKTPPGGTEVNDVTAWRAQWGMPNNALASNMPMWVNFTGTQNNLSSGRLWLTRIWLPAGATVTAVNFISGSTAGASLTHRWGALYDSSRVLLGQSADDTSTSWATFTAQAFTLGTPYAVTTSGNYYVGLMVAGTTMPTVYGITMSGTVLQGLPSPAISGTSSTGLTATAPNPAAALNVVNGVAFAWVT